MAETFFPRRYFPGSYFGEGYWRAAQSIGASFGDIAATLSSAATVSANTVASADMSATLSGIATVSATPPASAPSDVVTGGGGGGGGGIWFGQEFVPPRVPQYANAGALVFGVSTVKAQAMATARAASMSIGKSVMSAIATTDDGMIQADNAFWLLAA